MGTFDETVRLRLLSFFFLAPENEFYVKELARSVKASPGSVSVMCRKLAGSRILESNKKGNAIFYSLDNASPFVRRLKSAWFLEKLLAFRTVWENSDIQSVALYGSYASGEFVSKSDIDVLVLTNLDDAKVRDMLRRVGDGLRAEVSLTVVPVSRWRKLARERDRFYVEVISNHIVLYGNPLVI